MLMNITRFKEIEDRTIGKFTITEDGELFLSGYTCEPAGPDTILSGKDKRIPQGEYTITWHNSPRFNRLLPLISNSKVPATRCILIHSGNTGKNTEGCILVGKTYDNNGVWSSRETLNALIEIFQKAKDIKLVITNQIG